ncbi:tetratricopeptide repeat protein [Chengkuizengella sp. SCS-71B]|uniref:tetratricopeptide repeat protein n=1 Tax=Chengkuizengella sp. SCS-71B TaxID=3115290 RepID=UPI0032C239F6
MNEKNIIHRWIIGNKKSDREKEYMAEKDRPMIVVQSHRYRRGPYTGTGELLRKLIPTIYEKWNDVVEKHSIEVLSVAPELKTLISTREETLTSLAVPKERTRFYSRLRTLRITHGLIDLFNEITISQIVGPITIVFEEVDQCDPLDAEFLANFLRRANPQQIKIIISSKYEIPHEQLKTALDQYSNETSISNSILEEVGINNYSEIEQLKLAKEFIFSDGTSDDSNELAAYNSISPKDRQQFHLERLNELIGMNQWSLHIGSIPYHTERIGNKPKSVEVLLEAMDYCVDMGYYEATIDFSRRGRSLLNWQEDMVNMWAFTTKLTLSSAALGRTEEIPILYEEVLNNTTEDLSHMQASYALAMLYTRFQEEKEHIKAKGWILKAIRHAKKLEGDDKNRVFQIVFNENGLALIELHLGNPEEALRLVTDGWNTLKDKLEPDEHLLHRSVLLFNRAQILVSLKRYDEAIQIYDQVIEIDPNYPEYHFERGNLYSKIGLLEKAIENYNNAIQLSPPFPEVFYNRAAAYNRLGIREKALSDYHYLIDIEPEHADGLLNRATLLYEGGDYLNAREDVKKGLKLEPENPHLLCALGLIELAEENFVDSLRAFDAALMSDQKLCEAYTNRAIVYYELGKLDLAVNDLQQALSIEENATLYYNRAWVYEALGKWDEAIKDYTKSFVFRDVDEQDTYYRRGICFIKSGEVEKGHEDWKRHLSFGDTPYAEEMDNLIKVTSKGGA